MSVYGWHAWVWVGDLPSRAALICKRDLTAGEGEGQGHGAPDEHLGDRLE